MTYTSDRPITVDGVRLDTLAWNISKITRATAARRSADQTVPGRDGNLPSLNDNLEAASFGLEMFLKGTNGDGAVPSNRDSRTILQDNLDELVHLFGKRHALLEVTEQTGPGSPLENLVLNPGGDLNANNIGTAGSSTGTFSVDTVTKRTGAGSIKRTLSAVGQYGSANMHYLAPLKPSTIYTGVFWVRVNRAQAVTAWVEGAGIVTWGPLRTATFTMPADTWTKVVIQFTTPAVLPAETARIGPLFSTNLVTDEFWSDDVTLVEGPTEPEAFTGDYAEDTTYRYAWTGTASASSSRRIPKSTRRAWAKVQDSIAPDLNAPGSSAMFTVGLTLPYGVWEDEVAQDWTSGQTASGQGWAVTTLAGATERITDAIVLVAGPVTNPKLEDVATGAYVQLNAAIPAGQFWRVNVGTWATRYGAGLSLDSADTTGTDGQALTVYGGTLNQSAFLPLVPYRNAGARAVAVRLHGSAITTATRISVRARRKYAL